MADTKRYRFSVNWFEVTDDGRRVLMAYPPFEFADRATAERNRAQYFGSAEWAPKGAVDLDVTEIHEYLVPAGAPPVAGRVPSTG